MDNLERFINEDGLSDLDPLVKMAVIHHRFETIHPFYDGNGRTGRILNILYLVKEGLLGTPILYLSRYINQNKPEYYRLLQAVRDQEAWEEWVLFLLPGVEQTSRQTTGLVFGVRDLMLALQEPDAQRAAQHLHSGPPQQPVPPPLHEDRFRGLRAWASRGKRRRKYLEENVRIGLLSKHKLGRDNYYVNNELFNLFLNVGAQANAGK